VRIRRSTARVLPVDRDGRVLLQLGHEFHRSVWFWLTIGGGAERGESLAEAGAREMLEEAGVEVDPAELGRPIGTTVVRYPVFGLLPVIQYQTYFALAVDALEVSSARQSLIERLTIQRYQWLSADELEARTEDVGDPGLPRMIRTAVAAVRGPRSS
jgi:8-oxo-dGTP pyrophosphatase MutT (NUDIX family)